MHRLIPRFPRLQDLRGHQHATRGKYWQSKARRCSNCAAWRVFQSLPADVGIDFDCFVHVLRWIRFAGRRLLHEVGETTHLLQVEKNHR